MSNIRTWSRQSAISFSFVVLCTFLLIYRGSGILFGLLPQTMPLSFCEEIINMIWPVILAVLCGYGFALSMKGFGETLKAGIAFLIFYTVVLFCSYIVAAFTPGTQWQSLPGILLGILSLVGIGLREELIFRGIITNALALKYGNTTKGLWFAIVFSAFLFGIVHIPNFFFGVDLTGLIAQIIVATGVGIFFSALYLRGGNIWVPVIIHAVIDASGLFTSMFTVTTITNTDNMSNMSLSGVFFVLPLMIGLSMFLLRKAKQPAVFARLALLHEKFDI